MLSRRITAIETTFSKTTAIQQPPDVNYSTQTDLFQYHSFCIAFRTVKPPALNTKFRNHTHCSYYIY